MSSRLKMDKVIETLPKDYGDLRGEYDAIRGGVAVIDFSAAGKLQVSGKNSVQFLNGLISNDVKSLQAGEGVLAAFPTLQGKLVALCRIYNLGEYLLLELDAINREKIFKNLSRFVPAGKSGGLRFSSRLTADSAKPGSTSSFRPNSRRTLLKQF